MVFRFRRQPQKTLYLAFAIPFLLLRIPFWTLRYLLPAWRPRRAWSLGRSILAELIDAGTAIMLQTSLPAPEPLEKMALSAGKTGFVWVQPAPDFIVGDVQRFAEINGVASTKTGGFWYGTRTSDNAVGQRASPGEKVMGSGGPFFLPSAVMFQGFLKHMPQISRVFAAEYRLTTGPPLPAVNPYPAALIDVIAGYRYLVEDVGFDPGNIIVGGDSAGGILAYQLVHYLKAAAFPSLRNAGGLLLLSPSADSALRVNSDSMRNNVRSDYVRTWVYAAYGVNAILGSLSAEELDKPWMSPGSTMFSDDEMKGVFKDFPPTFILAGEAEMTRDPMRVLRDRMMADMGNQITYVEVANAPHDFLGLSVLEPERTEGLQEIEKWASTLFQS
ncbi:alpha/beta-hydrolase [Mycena filopes]|nr:alpha/beta-hydrolase [Mycena filopes]